MKYEICKSCKFKYNEDVFGKICNKCNGIYGAEDIIVLGIVHL